MAIFLNRQIGELKNIWLDIAYGSVIAIRQMAYVTSLTSHVSFSLIVRSTATSSAIRTISSGSSDAITVINSGESTFVTYVCNKRWLEPEL